MLSICSNVLCKCQSISLQIKLQIIKILSNGHPRASLVAQLVKNLPAMQETPVQFLGQKIPWRRNSLPTPVFLGFPCGSAGKESTCNVGNLGSIPGLGKSPGEGKGYPLQYCGLENSMGCEVQGVTKSQTGLSNLHFHFYILTKLCYTEALE